MFEIVKKKILTPAVTLIEVAAPVVAERAEPGQFVIVRAIEGGERIPLTIADSNRAAGKITLIFGRVGGTTERLGAIPEGGAVRDLLGPLGKPTELDGIKKAAVVGGGVGCAIAYPVAKKLREKGCEVHSIIGFRSSEQVILEREFELNCGTVIKMSDDGSWGKRGFVTGALGELLAAGKRYDEVIAVGPIMMMKAVAELTRPYGIKTIASMNPIMIDGTGMCGCCRLTVCGKTVFACVDGPDFDAHLIDFDGAAARCSMYKPYEKRKREENCRLFDAEVVK